MRTLAWICAKLTPSSSSSGGSPSYPSVEKAASHPVRRPPCSPMRPDTPTPGAGPKPAFVKPACAGVGLLPKPNEAGCEVAVVS